MLRVEANGSAARIFGQLSDGRKVDFTVCHGDKITARIERITLTGIVTGIEPNGANSYIDFKQETPHCLGRFCYVYQVIKINENFIK